MGLFGSLGWALAQRTLWIGRANNAWGASRIWNSGSSFETDSATWQSRANAAWGPSGVWSSGISYQSMIPPPGEQSFVAPVSGSLGAAGGSATWSYGSATDNNLGATNNGTSITVPKAGVYAIMVSAFGSNDTGNIGDTFTVTLTGSRHGTLGSIPFSMNASNVAGYARYIGILNAGEVVSVAASTSFDRYTVSGIVQISFLPTQANPN